MSLNWFANFLVHHPYVVLVGVAVFSGTCLIIPFTLKAFPSFSDPQTGYQTRGTAIANKLTTWHNLNEEISMGNLTVNPKDFLIRSNITYYFARPMTRTKKSKHKKKNKRRKAIKPREDQESNFTTSNQMGEAKILFEPANTTDRNEENWHELMGILNEGPKRKTPPPVPIDLVEPFFCGPPNVEYAHFVLASKYGADLFTLGSLQAICRIEREITEGNHYYDKCIKTSGGTRCCRPWSLPNYVALINHRESCLAITEDDVQSAKKLLQDCSYYYHIGKLTPHCADDERCRVPDKCKEENVAFQTLNFITSMSFVPPNKSNVVILKETMLFVPLACSAGLVPFFQGLSMDDQLTYDGITVVAINLGIKNALFDAYIMEDTRLLGLGALFVLICMWLYTGSLFLTVMTIIAIVFSLGISYFMYTLVFKLKFFPFMNLLTAVVILGIGADDAFIFCKIWQTMKDNNNGQSKAKIMACTLQHALVSMIITSFTTAAAFFASYVSSITAIRCFSVFASVAVVMNCVFMILWFPACIIVWEKIPQLQPNLLRGCISAIAVRWCCFSRWTSTLNFRSSLNFEILFSMREATIANSVIKFRHFWLASLTFLALISGIVVLVYPKLQLPNRADLQLFETSNMLERYDLFYKELFWFYNSNPSLNMPMRFVWGVVPQDNGNHMEPEQYGTLEYDAEFNMSDPESQKWLLDFCRDLKKQPFYVPEMGVIFPNCFIEPFKQWMERPCEDDMEGVDHSPCCETEEFPYRSWVFDQCIINAIYDLYATPSNIFIRGRAGPKFSTDQNATIKAVVVEFSSNYTFSLSFVSMFNFISDVEGWFGEMMKTAPPAMSGGWFISDLDFYDLQKTLSEGTTVAILMSMGLALAVVLLTTLNVLISLFAIINITCTILVTMAVLVLLGWKLNILESIAMSTAIGLAVDFALHYSLHYKLWASENDNRLTITRYILTKMLKPVSMSALTTGVVGLCMLPSSILAYKQIGTFLVVVMCISWFYSTFHLGAMLAIMGPENNFGQYTYTQLFCYVCKRNKSKLVRNQPTTSSVSESHELELLTSKSYSNTVSPPTTSITQQPQLSTRALQTLASDRTKSSDLSPSAISAITVIPDDT